MRKLMVPVIALVVASSGRSVAAQTATPAQSAPPAQTKPAATVPAVPSSRPSVQQTVAPVQAPASPAATTKSGGLSSTAILLMVLGGVALVLVIFAITFSQRRRPGEPGPGA
jgi:heme/copper-type cytochrome/quinol oxidase subunit 2